MARRAAAALLVLVLVQLSRSGVATREHSDALLLDTSLASHGRSLLQNNDVHPWGTILGYAYLFYEAQQSGVLPTWNRVRRANGGWRDNAHTTDGSDVGFDTSGGFYDAGDHVKYFVPFTTAFATLGLGAVMHEDGYRASGEWDNMARNLKYGADYIMKVINPAAGRVVAQVGDTGTDHAYWGRPEQQGGFRPTKLGRTADFQGSGAAVLASVSVILSKPGGLQDTGYAASLLARARDLLNAADSSPGTWSDAAYASSTYADDVALGYLMVCYADLQLTSGLPTSCTTALARYQVAKNSAFFSMNWDWDNQFFASSALLQLMSPRLQALMGVQQSFADSADYMSRTLASWQDTSKRCPTFAFDGTFQVCYSAGNLPYLTKWGSLRHAMNVAFAATLQGKAKAAAGDRVAARTNRCWARGLLLYAAGSNIKSQSYIVGYAPAGIKPADRPHHRSSSCDPNYAVTCDFNQLNFNGPSPSVLRGAMVGGPDNLDNFSDLRTDFVQNEVALDYNSGFSGNLAGTALITSRLAAAGCSWNTYCSGGCDAAADGGITPLSSPPPPPAVLSSPPPPPAILSSPPPPPAVLRSPPPPPAILSSPPPPPAILSSPPPPPAVLSSPPPPPAILSSPPPPPASTSSPPPPSSTAACKAPLPTYSQYACDQCLSSAVPTSLQPTCLSCPPRAFTLGNVWACTGVCTSPTYVGTNVQAANDCVNCLAVTAGGNCQNCLIGVNNLATRLGGVDVTAQRQGCFSCYQTALDTWACVSCLNKSTAAAVSTCLNCVANRLMPGWQCTA